MQSGVGLTEVNGFTRYELSGADMRGFLDRMTPSRLPTREGGRVALTYLLNHHGCVKSEATIAALPGGRFWYGAAAAAERHDMDWLTAHIRPPGEDVQIRDLTGSHTILLLAGPKARAVLGDVSREAWSAAAFPWLSVREGYIGIAPPAVIMAVSFSGEPAFEIHVETQFAASAWGGTLRAAGAAHGLSLFGGARAVESMRLEKGGFLHWKSELLTEFDPYETGLGRFVTDKPDYIGKTALAARRPPSGRLVTLHAKGDSPAHPGSSVELHGDVVGTVTAGAFGHRVGMNLAMAFVRPDLTVPGTAVTLDLIGEAVPATIIPPCPYDPPSHARLKEAT